MSQADVRMEYPELWDNATFSKFMSTSGARQDNFETIVEHYKQKLSHKRKRGNQAAHEKASARNLSKDLTAAKLAEKT